MPRDPNRWQLEVERLGPVTVARIVNADRLGESDVQELGDRLLEVIHAAASNLLLDLGGATTLSSSVLGKVLALYKTARARGGQLVLCGVSSRLRESLEALKLTRLFPACETREQGMAALSNCSR
jgi:anti-anti-sigma factor